MTLQPVRPGRAAFHQPPLSTHFAEDRHYCTGTADPRIMYDPGSGPWRSRSKTATVIAQYTALQLALNGGIPGLPGVVPTNIYPGRNATSHLRHYLGNTGLPYTIDLEDMIRSVPTARQAMVAEFRQAQAFLRTLPIGRHLFTSRMGENAYNTQQENADWFFAIGGYTYWGKGEATITGSKMGRHYDVDFTFCFYDRYNWDGDKEVEIGGVTITDEFMGEFNRQGLAREFDCRGSIKRKLAWDGEFGAPDQGIITTRQGR